MPHLPARFAGIILSFAPLFVHRSWRHAQALLIGAILCPGRRRVASVLRITGRAHDRHFVNIQRVLSRAAWSPHSAARILLRLLVEAFVPHGPVVLALDNTIERYWGRRIQAREIYRDPVRSSGAHVVKTSCLRWMSLMLLTLIPWAGRVWALPFLTALVTSERACRERGHRHKTLLDVGRQMTLQVRRWLPGAISCRWAIAPSWPYYISMPCAAAASPPSTAYAWMRRSTIPRPQGFRVRSGARVRRVHGGQPCPRS